MQAIETVQEIGKGGFGVVHKVRNEKGDLVARKTYQVNQAFANTPETDALLLPRFMREARLQSGIQHKNIVPILHTELQALPPYFFMPLAESTLERDIHADKILGGHYLLAIMDMIAALEEIHPLRIYHRDLKPGNVLRYADASDPRGYYYAISDFGLVALKQTQVSVLTQVGMKMTSDFYTAPEITTDLGRASPQSDIYSIGCILHDIVGTEPRIPCGEIREENGDFSGILLNCTRRNPDRRFQSVSSLRDALLDLQISSAPISAGSRIDLLTQLGQSATIPESVWHEIIDAIEGAPNSPQSIQLMRSINRDHLENLFITDVALGNRFGRFYSEWFRSETFIFSDCDGFANRIECIFHLGNIESKAESLMALLYMGTSHNRWYVERKFMSLISGIDEPLARRLAIEFRADGEKVCRAIGHLEQSINVKKSQLHQILTQTLMQMC